MSSSNPFFTKAFVVGATSGIGLSLANRLITQGTKVIVAGRRQPLLDHFVHQHGSEVASAYRLDITDLPSIAPFASNMAVAHPDLDCVIINAGIQRAFNFASPSTIDFTQIHDELTTNYTAPLYLSAAFLPHLQQRSAATGRDSHLIYVNANLALVPTMLRTPNYNASKAALHHWVMAFREQVKRASPSVGVKVVEIFPPAVRTELHDERHQPDLKDGREIGMPLEAFTDGVIQGLESGDETFAVGEQGQKLLDGFEKERVRVFEEGVEQVNKLLSRFMK